MGLPFILKKLKLRVTESTAEQHAAAAQAKQKVRQIINSESDNEAPAKKKRKKDKKTKKAKKSREDKGREELLQKKRAESM